MTDSSSQTSLDFTALHERLESLVFMVLSVRRSVEETAQQLATLDRARQERFLHAVEYVSKQTTELAYNLCMFGIHGLEILNPDEWEQWVQHILDTYDRGGVLASIVAMQKVGEFLQSVRQARAGVVRLEEVIGVLDRFVTALNGRPLRLRAADTIYTDTETVHLPHAVGRFEDSQQNYRLYKAMAVHQWAQTWFGTWRLSMQEQFARYEHAERAIHLFHALETIRLDACIARELPGVYREMHVLRQAGRLASTLPQWEMFSARLRQADASVVDSYELLEAAYSTGWNPQCVCYQGTLLPDQTESVIAQRKNRDKDSLRAAMTGLLEDLETGRGQERGESEEVPVFRVMKRATAELPTGFRFELQINGEPIAPLQDVQQVLDSIVQDLGDIPDEYLVAAGQGAYAPGVQHAERNDGVPGSAQGGELYDEWDYVRKHYRKAWCLLKERDVHPVDDDFVGRTLQKYRGLLRHLYRTFEALRGEDKRLRRQSDGDEIDIEAVIESYADQHAGMEWSERLFTKRMCVERDIAVMFLVDMSGSTKGWINEMEREALVLLCESLETLGDRYAIYGFSGFTHKRCELLRIKRMEEPYNEEVQARISGIKPQDYTRLGAFIRHMTREFQNVEARTKLLITLSDGRPDDQDGYRGTYGIEDTRQALFEARYQGVHPYCITIDEEGMDYLPHMYGPANFTVISDVHKLPYRVSDIYRRITR